MSARKHRREPLISEMLTDPTLLVMLDSDGVTPEELLTLVIEVRQRLEQRTQQEPRQRSSAA